MIVAKAGSTVTRALTNILDAPPDVLRIILSYVLSFDRPSYVASLLTCKRILAAANGDPILQKKLALIQMKFFCFNNRAIELERPDPYDPETATIETYGGLSASVDEMLCNLAQREALQSVEIARGTIQLVTNENLRRKATDKMLFHLALRQAEQNIQIAKETIQLISDANLREQALEILSKKPQVAPPRISRVLTEEEERNRGEVVAKKIAYLILEGTLSPEIEMVDKKIGARYEYRLRTRDKITIAVVKNLADRDLSKAEKLVDSIPSYTNNIEPRLREAASIEVLKVKAKTDPLNTMQRSLDLHYLNGDPAFSDIFEVVVTCNLEVAEKFALAMDRKAWQRDVAMLQVIKTLVDKDIDKASRYVSEIKNPSYQEQAIEAILVFARKNNRAKYDQLVQSVQDQQSPISDLVLLVATRIEAQENIALAWQTAEKIKDGEIRGFAWLSILKVLASNPSPKKEEIDEAMTHLPSKLFGALISELVEVNIPLAITLTLQNQPSTGRDRNILQLVDKFVQTNLPKALEFILQISDESERDDRLSHFIDDAKDDLGLMKLATKALRHDPLTLAHYDALEFIRDRIENWWRQ